jgi:hypothetical protein
VRSLWHGGFKYKYVEEKDMGEGTMGGGLRTRLRLWLSAPSSSGSAWMDKTGVVWPVWWCRRCSDQRQDGRLITRRAPACHGLGSPARDPCIPCLLLSRENTSPSSACESHPFLLSHSSSCLFILSVLRTSPNAFEALS